MLEEGKHSDRTINHLLRDIVVGVLAGVVIDATIQALHLEALFPTLPYIWFGIVTYLTVDSLRRQKVQERVVTFYGQLNKGQRMVSYIVVGIMGIMVAEAYWVGRKKIFELRATKSAVSAGSSTTELEKAKEAGRTAATVLTPSTQGTESHGTNDNIEVKPETPGMAEHPGTSDKPTVKAEHKAAEAPKPPVTIVQQTAPYGNLAVRCNSLGDAIISFANDRNQSRPALSDRDSYNNWYRLNDGLFQAEFVLRYINDIHKVCLLARRIKNVRLTKGELKMEW